MSKPSHEMFLKTNLQLSKYLLMKYCTKLCTIKHNVIFKIVEMIQNTRNDQPIVERSFWKSWFAHADILIVVLKVLASWNFTLYVVSKISSTWSTLLLYESKTNVGVLTPWKCIKKLKASKLWNKMLNILLRLFALGTGSRPLSLPPRQDSEKIHCTGIHYAGC